MAPQEQEKSVRMADNTTTTGSARVYYYPFALVLRLRVLQVSERGKGNISDGLLTSTSSLFTVRTYRFLVLKFNLFADRFRHHIPNSWQRGLY